MHGAPGDWLVVKSARDTVHARHAEIIAVSEGGAPPFTVRWTDTGREGLVFPGPDAVVVPAEEQAEHDRQEAERVQRLQHQLGAQHRG